MSKVLEIWPNAMPSAPSISWAAKPIRMKGRRMAGSASDSRSIEASCLCCSRANAAGQSGSQAALARNSGGSAGNWQDDDLN